jgi:hypothetical protein
MALDTDINMSLVKRRRPHQKSRTGCSDCRRRRVKVRIGPSLNIPLDAKCTSPNSAVSAASKSRPAALACGVICHVSTYRTFKVAIAALQKPRGLPATHQRKLLPILGRLGSWRLSLLLLQTRRPHLHHPRLHPRKPPRSPRPLI